MSEDSPPSYDSSLLDKPNGFSFKRRKLRESECPTCGQDLERVKMLNEPPPNGLEEEVALADERLLLYNDGEQIPEIDSRPQNKITRFDVFDKEGHLCPFDSGLIEKNVLLYFSGYVKPIYDEDKTPNNGVPAYELGPILQWYISGYDRGDRFLIAFTTPCGDYVLMDPSPDYEIFMREPRQKALLAKIVVEFLGNSYEPVYEELLSRIQEVTVPDGIEPFNEDSIAQHAQFIVDQVSEIDDEGEFLASPAMQTFVKLHGVKVGKVSSRLKRQQQKTNLKLTKATMTPLVSKIFEGFFDNNQTYFSYNKTPEKKDMTLPVTRDFKELSKVSWQEGSRCAVVNDEVISVGDFVYISSRDVVKRNRIFRIESFFQTNYTKQVHCTEYCRSGDTILGEASNPLEFFLTDECGDWPICKIIAKADVVVGSPPETWNRFLEYRPRHEGFFVQKAYLPAHGRFQDLPNLDTCPICRQKEEQLKETTPESITENGVTSVRYKGEVYTTGCCVLIEPFAFTFDAQKSDRMIEKKIVRFEADEIIYSEIYRKVKEVSIVDECPEPFKIGYVNKIEIRQVRHTKKIYLIVNKFYRPENTNIIDQTNEDYYDTNLLYWSDETAEVDFEHVKGRCNVVRSKTAPPLNQFYFFLKFDHAEKSLKLAEDVDLKVTAQPSETRKLRTLNPFSGAGGLAKGLEQSGAAEILWGIEIDASTAKSYELNFPKAQVFHTDCNVFLEDLLNGALKDPHPEKGDVEFLCGGPPCQGFSTMNRFTAQQYSQFKNSLIVSYLSFCDYYRPKYFLLENVRNFATFKKSALLKHTIGCLISMGYQCSFGVLQGGNYGLPQTRRRLFVLAAAPGHPLPKFPDPTHVFYGQLCAYDVEIDNKRYIPDYGAAHTAPFRNITIRDALRDLPPVKSSFGKGLTPYLRFLMSSNAIIRDHVCKDVSALNEARIKHIPAAKDCDWRDLPNIPVRLRDGSVTDVLKYTHHDRKNGKSRCGLLRGVCSCASGEPCDLTLRQNNTLIPWFLSHTANRNNNWSGLYGRLDWDGYFSTTITNPEPSCKQGRVLHPQEDRIVSVRECARSQGLPDTFRVCGTVMEKYRQVGNAVPPPMSRAFGHEIKKCMKS